MCVMAVWLIEVWFLVVSLIRESLGCNSVL